MKSPRIYQLFGFSFCFFYIGFSKKVTKSIFWEIRYDDTMCSLKTITKALHVMGIPERMYFVRHAIYINHQPFLSLKDTQEFECFEFKKILFCFLLVKFKRLKNEHDSL